MWHRKWGEAGEGVREKSTWQENCSGMEGSRRLSPESLAFTPDQASPPSLANLYICLSFPPSVKVSTQHIAVICLWRHRSTHPSGIFIWWNDEERAASLKLTGRILNICRCIFSLCVCHHPPLIKHSPLTPPHHHHPIFFCLNGFNWLFRDRHSGVIDRSLLHTHPDHVF